MRISSARLNLRGILLNLYVRLFSIPTFILLGCGSLPAQISILTCNPSANPPVVRAEGLTERIGDILMACSGGNPNGHVSGNLTLFANAPVTNRVNGSTLNGINLTYDNGSGPQPTVPAMLASPSSIVFNDVSFSLSTPGSVNLLLTGVRVNVTTFNAPIMNGPLTAFTAFNPGNVLLMSGSE